MPKCFTTILMVKSTFLEVLTLRCYINQNSILSCKSILCLDVKEITAFIFLKTSL